MENINSDFIKYLTDEDSSDHCDQLEMFYDNADDVFGSLNQLLPKSEDVVSYGREHSNEAPAIDPEEALGYLAVNPTQNSGLSIVIQCDAKTKKNRVKAVFPFIGEGNKYPCSIQNVSVYENHLEAVISAFVDEDQNLLLNFYDAHYLDNRAFYNNKDTFQFIIRGLAYCVEVNEAPDPLELQKLAGVVDKDAKADMDINPNSVIAVFPREDMGADHYEIQSPVLDIEETEKINGQRVWRLGLVLGTTPSGDDIPLDVYISESSLADSELPRVGDNVSVVVWLQGHLWGIGNDEA